MAILSRNWLFLILASAATIACRARRRRAATPRFPGAPFIASAPLAVIGAIVRGRGTAAAERVAGASPADWIRTQPPSVGAESQRFGGATEVSGTSQ